jgi:hypothetical protein
LQSWVKAPKAVNRSQKGIKKPPGMPAVEEVSGRFFQVRSELSAASGVGEPKITKEKYSAIHDENVAQVIFVPALGKEPTP